MSDGLVERLAAKYKGEALGGGNDAYARMVAAFFCAAIAEELEASALEAPVGVWAARWLREATDTRKEPGR